MNEVESETFSPILGATKDDLTLIDNDEILIPEQRKRKR